MSTQPEHMELANTQAVRRFAVLASAAGLSTWAIDMAATQIGLPSQQSSLGLTVTASQWILNITLMIVAGLVTVGGSLGDRLGRTRVFRWGIILIAVGAAMTFGGGLLNSFVIILVGRGIEGLGAAFFIPASTALLLDVFTQQERGMAQGQMMMISMFIMAFAPTVAGLIIQAISWPYAYLMTIVSAAITFLLLGKVKYDQTKPKLTPFDYTGSALLFVAVSLLTIGIMQAGTASFISPLVLIPVGIGLVLGTILVFVSLRKADPLIQFRLMQIRSVAIGIFVVFMRFLPNVLMGVFVARYVQQVIGLSPTATGLLMIIPVLSQVVAAPIAGRILDQEGARRPTVTGISLLAAGLVVLALGFQGSNLWLILIGTIVGGAGFAFTNPVQMAALSETPLEQRGMLAGIFPLAGNFGTAFWVALLTAGLSSFMNCFVATNPGATESAAQSSALFILTWIAVACMLVTLFIGLRLRQAKKTEQKVEMPVAVSSEE